MKTKFKGSVGFFVFFIVISLSVINLAVAKSGNWGRGGSLATASVGGTYYVWGGAWAKLATNNLGGFSVSVEVTGGPVHNVKLVTSKDAMFGLCSMPTAYDAYKGLRWAKGVKYQDIRVLFPMYPSFATLWGPKKSNIHNFRDLNGKVVNLGPKGGTPDTYYRIMLDILGIKPKKIVNSGFTDLVGQMKDGMIEAGGGTGGSPFGPAMQTEATHEITLFSLAEADMKTVRAELPSWFVGKIAKEGFKCLTEDLPTLQYWNILITHKDLPDDLAYEITKMYFEKLPYFKDVYKPTMNTKPKDIKTAVIPLHPGAAKYYKEKGIAIP